MKFVVVILALALVFIIQKMKRTQMEKNRMKKLNPKEVTDYVNSTDEIKKD